jgi:hypothetical protein
MAQQMGASAVYCQGEVTGEEVAVEERVQTALGTVNANLKRFWGSTLFHIEDLPFKLDAMPSNYGVLSKPISVLSCVSSVYHVSVIPPFHVVVPVPVCFNDLVGFGAEWVNFGVAVIRVPPSAFLCGLNLFSFSALPHAYSNPEPRWPVLTTNGLLCQNTSAKL